MGTPVPLNDLPQEMQPIDQGKAVPAADLPRGVATNPNASPSILDYGKALLTGINRGTYANLLGMPADTIANAEDLAKAAIGYPYSKLTGKPPPDWTAPMDRAQVPGTSDWIANKMNEGARNLGVVSPVNNPIPQSGLGQILHATGTGIGSAVAPASSGTQALKNVALGGLSGMAAGSAGAAGASPEAQILAGMLPGAAGKAIGGATRLALTGGPENQQRVAQRVQDLKNAGIESPSLGLSTGSPLIMGIENLASKLPGSVGTFQNAATGNIQGMQNKIKAMRDAASPSYGAIPAGAMLQKDITNFPATRIDPTYSGLLDKVMDIVGPQTQTAIPNTLSTARQLAAPNPGAPASTKALIIPAIDKMSKALASDTALSPPPSSNAFIPGASALTTPQEPSIPFQALRNLRTGIGAEARSKDITATPAEAQYKNLYGAMSQDIGQGTQAVDRANATRLGELRAQDTLTPSEMKELSTLEASAQTPTGQQQMVQASTGPLSPSQTPASNAWNRSNDFYSAAMDRVKKLQPIADMSSPEAAYRAYVGAAPGNVTTMNAVKKSITPDTRSAIASTILDQMGLASPGKQDNTGNVFSPETYLTQYNKLGEPGRQALFSGFHGSENINSGTQDVAKGASMLRDASKIWANPSGTGGNVMAAAGMGGILSNLFSNPGVAAGGALGLLGGNIAARKLLLNPDFINYMIKQQQPNSPRIQSGLQTLMNNATMGLQGTEDQSQ
jgi:hypothetical protein